VPPSTASGTCTDFVTQVSNNPGDAGPCTADSSAKLCADSQNLCIDLAPSDAGPMKCNLLAMLRTPGNESMCTALGVPTPDANTLMQFRSQAESAWQSMGGAASGQPDPSKLPICIVPQLTGSDLDANGSCGASPKPGFCVVANPNCGINPAVVVTPGGWLNGALITIDCQTGC
jgi:hypothetical protein